MTPDQPIGRPMTADEALELYARCMAAEKAMGPLTREERTVIANSIGKAVTLEDLSELIAGKRILQVKGEGQC